MGQDLVRRFFAAVDDRSWELLPLSFAEDVVYERPGYPCIVGVQELLRFYREVRVVHSGQHFLDQVIIHEDRGASFGRFVGVHRDGSHIDERFAEFYEFAHGRIRRRNTFFFRPAV